MTEFPNESDDLIEEAAQADVPDVEEQLDQGQASDTLVDRGVDDALDEGYSPPERYSSAERFGNTAEEMREGEPFEERLRQEVPEPRIVYGEEGDEDPDDSEDSLDEPLLDDVLNERIVYGEEGDDELELDYERDNLDDGEVGDVRAGRLVDPDQGIGTDTEKDLVGDDVGIDGAGASAEEAAVHVVDDGDERSS